MSSEIWSDSKFYVYITLIISIIKVLNRAYFRILNDIITIILGNCKFFILFNWRINAACYSKLSRISIDAIIWWASCIYCQVSIICDWYSVILIDICWTLMLNNALVKRAWWFPSCYILKICVINKIVIRITISLFIGSI